MVDNGLHKTREERGDEVRSFILDNVSAHPSNIANFAAAHFGMSRQAIHKHLSKLVERGLIAQTGKTRNRVYALNASSPFTKTYRLDTKLEEDIVWEQDVGKFIAPLPANVMGIWQFGFTEMFNNAIDHSGGTSIRLRISKTAALTKITLADDGIGIFKKIQAALGLADERHAVLELAKGKLTTDPAHHSGEGIFFTSRLMDSFAIISGGVRLQHQFGKPKDWILETDQAPRTTVVMELRNDTTRTSAEIFSVYTSGDDYGFTKTVVPVRLAQYGSDLLMSRSQAKRLLTRVDLFETVLLDFEGISEIGQAFADEIFRVFARQHPNVKLMALNESDQVKRMISRAQHAT
jgi:anti-sigma regulatory factor (Ser/Thr protein kinase)/DNA-binding transcriptional ArsR family regulator